MGNNYGGRWAWISSHKYCTWIISGSCFGALYYGFVEDKESPSKRNDCKCKVRNQDLGSFFCVCSDIFGIGNYDKSLDEYQLEYVASVVDVGSDRNFKCCDCGCV